MKNKKNKQVIAIIAIVALLMAILTVLNFEKIQSFFANTLSSNQTELRQARFYKQKKKPDYNLRHVKPISPDSLLDAWRHRHDYRAIGQIAIADHNILLNIYRGTGNNELALGAGTFRADQRMGHNNYPLAAHNMDDGRSYFSPLYTAKVAGKLKAGATICLTDFKNVYFYRITTSRFVGVQNLSLSYNAKKYARTPVITLFTCDSTGQGRLYIQGKLTGSQSLRSAGKYVRSSFAID